MPVQSGGFLFIWIDSYFRKLVNDVANGFGFRILTNVVMNPVQPVFDPQFRHRFEFIVCGVAGVAECGG